MKSLTGLTIEEFELLLPLFDHVLHESFATRKRKRRVGAGRKGALVSAKEKLFFILFYLKIYPTFDFAGFIFKADRRRAFEWSKIFTPLLEKALGRSVIMPQKRINSLEAFYDAYPEVKDLFIDGTERRTQRPTKPQKRQKKYSGKKKAYTRKNTVICDENKRILFVSPTSGGRTHDLRQLKKSQVLNTIPSSITLWVDKGYQGIKHMTKPWHQVMIPHKKTKKIPLTAKQKEDNRLISGLRIVVEHAICGIKRFTALTTLARCRGGQDDQWMRVCAGLWNFHLQHKAC